MATERVEGPTPNGGAYAVIVYLGEDGDQAEKEQAAAAEVVEYDEQDEAIFRTYANFKSVRGTDEEPIRTA